jgi:hypothetical protein
MKENKVNAYVRTVEQHAAASQRISYSLSFELPLREYKKAKLVRLLRAF